MSKIQVLKFLIISQVFSSLILSFLQIYRPSYTCPAVTQSRQSLIPSLQEDVPTNLLRQLITQKLRKRISFRRVWKKMKEWGDQGLHFDTVPVFSLPTSCWPTSAPSTLRYSDLACSTGSQQDQNTSQLPGLHSQKFCMCQTFQSLLGKWHKLVTDCWVLFDETYLDSCGEDLSLKQCRAYNDHFCNEL